MVVEHNIERREYLSRGEGNYCSKLKKRLKIKKLLKFTSYIRWTRALSTIIRASLKLREYVFTKTWKWSCILASISENWVPCQKESQTASSESSHVQWSFIQKKAYSCLRPCSLDNTLNRPRTSAWESFNVRHKN